MRPSEILVPKGGTRDFGLILPNHMFMSKNDLVLTYSLNRVNIYHMAKLFDTKEVDGTPYVVMRCRWIKTERGDMDESVPLPVLAGN